MFIYVSYLAHGQAPSKFEERERKRKDKCHQQKHGWQQNLERNFTGTSLCDERVKGTGAESEGWVQRAFREGGMGNRELVKGMQDKGAELKTSQCNLV